MTGKIKTILDFDSFASGDYLHFTEYGPCAQEWLVMWVAKQAARK